METPYRNPVLASCCKEPNTTKASLGACPDESDLQKLNSAIRTLNSAARRLDVAVSMRSNGPTPETDGKPLQSEYPLADGCTQVRQAAELIHKSMDELFLRIGI